MDEQDKDDGSKPDPLIIYHGECSDGFCAAWVARLAMPRADTYAALHNQEPPDVRGREVYMLDFCYSRDTLDKMADDARSLLILDHHKSAQKSLCEDGPTLSDRFIAGLAGAMIPPPAKPRKFKAIFDMAKSGAGLAWDYFRSQIKDSRETPWLVEYVQDRDLWEWKLRDSHEVNAALDTYPMDFEVWTNLWKQPREQTLARMSDEGKPIIRYQERLVDRIVRSAREVKIGSYRVRAVNTATLMGEAAYRLAQDRPFGVAWFQRADGQYVYSLRSYDRVDVSEIASAFKGGGHRNSAGFETHELIF